MPLAWELKALRQLQVGILHVDTTTVAWAFGLRNLIIPGPHPMPVTGMPFDMARNVVAQVVLERGIEWLGYLDSDVVPSPDAFLRLMRHNQPIMSGLYCRRSPPAGVPVMIRNGRWVTQYRSGSVIDVDVVGAGLVVIHRSVLEALPPLDERRGKRWFDWRVDMQGNGVLPPGEAMSEDFVFFHAVRTQLGIPIKVDTSVVARHIGYGQSKHGVFEPCEATPVT